MASSSSCPDGAAAAPPPPHGVAGPSAWGACQQRAPGSTAQANLRKIISIITTVLPLRVHPNVLQPQLAPPHPPTAPLERGEGESRVLSALSDGYRMRIDLRLRLGPSWEMGRRSSTDEEEDHEAGLPSSACSVVGGGTTKLTGDGGGSSGAAAPETAESGIVSATCDVTPGPRMLDSNSPGERSCEGEWDAGGERVEEEGAKEARAEERDEEHGGVLEEEEEGRPCSEITNIRGHTGGGGGTEESGVTKAGRVDVDTEEGVVVEEQEKKRSSSGNVDRDSEGQTGKSCRKRDDEGYLGLLLEAVRQVSGGFFGDEPPAKEELAEEGRQELSKRGRCLAAAFEEEQTLGPVVRSKRGRSQALPSRYRDSVLEPWRKQSSGGGGGAGLQRHLQRRQARTTR